MWNFDETVLWVLGLTLAGFGMAGIKHNEPWAVVGGCVCVLVGVFLVTLMFSIRRAAAKNKEVAAKNKEVIDTALSKLRATLEAIPTPPKPRVDSPKVPQGSKVTKGGLN